ncbi:uncharacterized protein LOC130137499 [Syzygium oleosum]|uniref:uncharacterized protein LOC130137499 n=1 Tax=Syzygium oleosum TaxID=219896 RepID=UPI0024B94CF8|nr:uncharacterized protein LOC130137499 [Syzygium oleosum]
MATINSVEASGSQINLTQPEDNSNGSLNDLVPPILATSDLGTTASTQPIDSHITLGSPVHFTEVSPSSSTLSLATALIPVQSAAVPSTQPSSSHSLPYAEERNSPQSLLKTRRMLDEASHILGFTSNVASPRQMAIEKVRDKLLRLLDLSSGGFPMLLCNQTAFDRLKFLLDELCSAKPSEILPPELKAKLDDFSKAFVSRIESYQHNYDLIISLTLSDQPYPENNQVINELSHTVKERKTNLHALVEEISGLDEEEILLEKQKVEIEQKLAFFRDTRKFKHTQRLQLEMDFDKDITILKELKQTEHQRRLAAEAENRRTKNKCITENGQFDRSMLSLQSDVKKLLFPKKNSNQ